MPRLLAAAILADHRGELPLEGMVDPFHAEVVARLPEEGFELRQSASMAGSPTTASDGLLQDPD